MIKGNCEQLKVTVNEITILCPPMANPHAFVNESMDAASPTYML
jgi:hypothetical protein